MESTSVAEPASAGQSPSQAQSVLAFLLAGRRHALPIGAIVQIIPMVKLVELPQSHPALAGIMAFRGHPVPVVALRTYMGLPECAAAVDTPIILIQTEPVDGHGAHQVVGLIVDEVEGVLSIDPDRILSVAETLPETLADLPLLCGLLQTPDGVLLFLDLAKLFLIAPSGAALDHVAELLVADVRSVPEPEQRPVPDEIVERD